MSENSAEVKSENSVETDTQPQEEKPTGRGKRSASKRVSLLTRTAQEGEAILKGMGHKEDGATEGRRTTRSSSRGSTGSQATPPPAKRERKAPSTGKGSRRGRPKKGEEPEEENDEAESERKSESKDEEKKEDKAENGKTDDAEKKENNVDATDGGGDAKPMEVEESEKPAAAEGDKPSNHLSEGDNGPAEQPSSPAKTEETPSKPEEPEKPEAETKKEEESSKPESGEEKKEVDTREAPPPQSE